MHDGAPERDVRRRPAHRAETDLRRMRRRRSVANRDVEVQRHEVRLPGSKGSHGLAQQGWGPVRRLDPDRHLAVRNLQLHADPAMMKAQEVRRKRDCREGPVPARRRHDADAFAVCGGLGGLGGDQIRQGKIRRWLPDAVLAWRLDRFPYREA